MTLNQALRKCGELRFFGVMLLAGGLLFAGGEANAATCWGAVGDDNCTANDGLETTVEAISPPATCVAGTTFDVVLKFTTTPTTTRYNYGVWVGLNGKSPNAAADNPICDAQALLPSTGTLDLLGGNGPYTEADANAGACGDILNGQTAARLIPGTQGFFPNSAGDTTLTVTCVDLGVGVTNQVDVPWCVADSNQNTANTCAVTELGPSQTSKCGCGTLELATIIEEPTTTTTSTTSTTQPTTTTTTSTTSTTQPTTTTTTSTTQPTTTTTTSTTQPTTTTTTSTTSTTQPTTTTTTSTTSTTTSSTAPTTTSTTSDPGPSTTRPPDPIPAVGAAIIPLLASLFGALGLFGLYRRR